MDALSSVLRTMRLKGGVFLYADFFEPWCLSVQVLPESCAPFLGETEQIVPYHFVIEGVMRVRMQDGQEIEVSAGDAVVFPHNDLHLLGSDFEIPPVASETVVQRSDEGGLAAITLGGKGRPTRIVCGFLGAEDVRGNPILDTLPCVLKLSTRGGAYAEWICSTFRFAADEICQGRPGSEAALAKLSELLFVEAIRSHINELPSAQVGWLAGLRDPQIARALALLHADAGKPWTVDDLARQVGLSRSALADRFVQLLDQPPMQYVAAWRMHMAGHELLHTAKSISQVAHEVGYDTEAAFSRAFKRFMDTPPATWRRQRQS